MTRQLTQKMIRNKWQELGKLKFPDAIIAVTALFNNATLISADNKFSKLFNLKF